MRLNEIITESLSRIAYHYTNPSAALRILKSGVFELSSALGSRAEQDHMPPGKPYFLSATRTRLGGYHAQSAGSRGVLFVLDGNWFNQRYQSRPVDYWGDRGKMGDYGRASEAEDRVFSSEPTIAVDGVRAVHVFLNISDGDTEHESHDRAVVRELLIAAKTRGIETYFYTDRRAWYALDTRKTADTSHLTGQKRTGFYRPMRRRTYMQNWIELMNAQSEDQLTKEADKLRYNLNYDYDREHAIQSLEVDMSNARKPNSGPERNDLVKIIAYMRQHRLNTMKDFVEHIAAKWKKK